MSSIARRARVAGAVFASVSVVLIGTGVLASGSAGASREPGSYLSAPGSGRPAVASRASEVLAGVNAAAERGLVATSRDGGGLAVYDAPGAIAASQLFPATNELGSPLTFLTVSHQPGWFEVLLPTRPNASTAWVPAASVTVNAPTVRVEISLAAHELRLLRVGDGAVLLTSPVGIGAPERPTPTGRFFVRDLFPTSGGNHPYGPMAFGLSGHSDVLTQFGTGDGRIAIHGTNQPSSIGADASNGCVHVPNDIDAALEQYLSLGTPVVIS